MVQITTNLALAALGAAVIVSGGAGTMHPAGAETPAPRTQPGQNKLNPDLLNLPPNTWVKIKPNRNPEGRSFSGICWGDGLIFYFGGSHGSYRCNDVELYDVAANTWTQATEPEDWQDAKHWKYVTPEQLKELPAIVAALGASAGGILSPKGRPLTAHTYQQHVWFPEERAFYQMMKRVGLWAFDPAQKEWRLVTKQTPEIRDLSGFGLYYDPGLKSIFAITAGGPSGAYVFDREKKTWVLRCKLPLGDWSEVHAAYDSTRKVHVVHTQRRWYALDLAAATFTPIKGPDEVIKAAGKFPATVNELQEASLAYDAQAKATLLLTKQKVYDNNRLPVDLWAYDAQQDDWSEVKLSGQAPTGCYRWGLLVYDPEHKCCLLLNVLGVQGSPRWGGPVDGLFAFRLKK